MKAAAALISVCAWLGTCAGQQAGPPVDLVATPNRPTVTNTADTTQQGVLELEFGVAAASRQQSLQGLMKFGLLRDLELQWAGSPWQHDASLRQSGITDTAVGFRWRFMHQSGDRPTLSFQYNAKLPTAGPVLGSGRSDHVVTLLASKDVSSKFRLDGNLSYAWLGRRGGYDNAWLPTADLVRSLSEKWDVAVEFSGSTRANAQTPPIVQNLWAVSYALRPRLVLDTAIQFGITGNVPRAVFLAGFTYSIADVYRRRW